MKKLIAFGASNSRKSINKQFAIWASEQINDVEVEVLDLNEFEMPIYSVDREQESGIPAEAQNFKDKINQSDGIIISFAEHNGSYSAAFKNIADWVSRMDRHTWSNKPMLLLATSPGPRGAQGVLTTAASSFPHQGGQVTGSFSLPSFNTNFSLSEGIKNNELKEAFNQLIHNFNNTLHETSTEEAATGA